MTTGGDQAGTRYGNSIPLAQDLERITPCIRDATTGVHRVCCAVTPGEGTLPQGGGSERTDLMVKSRRGNGIPSAPHELDGLIAPALLSSSGPS